MSTYAIGDIQGCWRTLEDLLAKISWDPARDRLWLVGDLVNRGPDSLAVLRWARAHDGSITAVLGNHDLHLLAIAAGVRQLKRGDTLGEILAAPDREELLAWLRRRPLLHCEGGWILVHAGLLPAWTLAEAIALARELEVRLRGPRAADLLRTAQTLATLRWREGLGGRARRALALSALTRLRMCRRDGAMDPDFDGPPAEAPSGLLPWFRLPSSRDGSETIICGHWAALGLHLEEGVAALDSGCVWGGSLSALRLEDGSVFQVPSLDGRQCSED